MSSHSQPMAPQSVVLQSAGLTFGFNPGEPLIDNLSLSLHRGETLVILGPSGAGKSTLLKLWAKLLKPTQGRVEYPGAQSMNSRAFLSMTFQHSGLFDSLTCEENLILPLEESGQSDKEAISEKVKVMLAAVGLSGIEKLRTYRLSGGMRKRLGIARALILEPLVLCYDEPTSGLDPITSRGIAELIRADCRANRLASVVVTGDIGLAAFLASRIAFLYHGKILVDAPVDDFFRSSNEIVQQFITGGLKGPLTDGEVSA